MPALPPWLLRPCKGCFMIVTITQPPLVSQSLYQAPCSLAGPLPTSLSPSYTSSPFVCCAVQCFWFLKVPCLPLVPLYFLSLPYSLPLYLQVSQFKQITLSHHPLFFTVLISTWNHRVNVYLFWDLGCPVHHNMSNTWNGAQYTWQTLSKYIFLLIDGKILHF